MEYCIYSIKCRIWDKKVNKRRPRISDALSADIFALIIMKLSAFFLVIID